MRAAPSAPFPRPAARGRWSASPWLIPLLVAVVPASAPAQPQGPATLVGGRLVVAARAAASVASGDPGYFDHSSYDDNLMRLVRFDATARFRLSTRFFLIGDLRLEGTSSGGSWRLRPYAAFARLRPWPRRTVDIQAGIVPPVFGAFSRRAYADDNPLIGFPLAYQYLTALRADAIPASADDLLAMRGRGWRARYPLGNTSAGAGLPLIDGTRYQSGVQVRAGSGRPVEASAAITSGSLSLPAGRHARFGRQVSARLAVRPLDGLALGVSLSRGSYLARTVSDHRAVSDVTSASPGTQRALGVDAEFSRGHWLLRTEGVFSQWSLPRLAEPRLPGRLGAFGLSVEGRYRLRPGLYAAARFDHLGFSEVSGSAGRMPWDAPVRRVEIGGGYSVTRNVVVKVAWQHNRRDAGATRRQQVVAAQVVAWY